MNSKFRSLQETLDLPNALQLCTIGMDERVRMLVFEEYAENKSDDMKLQKRTPEPSTGRRS
ncbi:hypothetical protein BBI08_03775 [Planococcus halocryophilus]|uniref:Uncharacterized protein n=1 Tax=Planococcus halocryophilus TaxID=1215089 RepID=A0A1C7DNH1_9BACL|nr:hypothetical protein BBI08_03775 [Planococcus halocryophilus]